MATRAGAIEDRYTRQIDFEKRRAAQEQLGKEHEPAFGAFLAHAGKGVFREVRQGTETEDHEMIDFVVTLNNGKRIAIQYSIAQDPEIQRTKLKMVEHRPVVGKLFDEQGRAVVVEQMPRVLISGGRPEEWRTALEHYQRGDAPQTYFSDSEARSNFILEQFIRNFEYLAHKHPRLRNFFLEYISYMEPGIGTANQAA